MFPTTKTLNEMIKLLITLAKYALTVLLFLILLFTVRPVHVWIWALPIWAIFKVPLSILEGYTVFKIAQGLVKWTFKK